MMKIVPCRRSRRVLGSRSNLGGLEKMASRKKVSKKKSNKRAKAAAKKKAQPIPAGYHTATPYLVCRGAAGAIDFYKRAFGAKEKMRMPGPDGRGAHAELQIGDPRVLLGEGK